MGAISDPSSVPILKEFLTDPERSVRETCEIAMAKIEWDNSEEGKKHHASLDESSVQYVASHSYFPAFDKSLSGAGFTHPSIPHHPPPGSCAALKKQRMFLRKELSGYERNSWTPTYPSSNDIAPCSPCATSAPPRLSTPSPLVSPMTVPSSSKPKPIFRPNQTLI